MNDDPPNVIACVLGIDPPSGPTHGEGPFRLPIQMVTLAGSRSADNRGHPSRSPSSMRSRETVEDGPRASLSIVLFLRSRARRTRAVRAGDRLMVHHVLGDAAVSGLPDVGEVGGAGQPRGGGAGLGQLALGLDDVGGVEVEDGSGYHVGVGVHGRGDGDLTLLPHAVQESGDELGGGVGAEGPGGVGVADDDGRVRDALDHGALPDVLVGHAHGLAVDGDVGTTEQADAEAGGGDDDVGVEDLGGVLEDDALLGDLLDVSGDDFGVLTADGLVEVAAGADAEALLPRPVRGGEVRVHGVALGQLTAGASEQDSLRRLGEGAAELEEDEGEDEELEADELVGPGLGEEHLEELAGGVDAGEGHDVGGAALQHGDLSGLLGQVGEKGDGGGAAADDDDVLAGVVEILGPELRVDGLTLEVVDAGNVGLEGLIVVIVSGGVDHEAGAEGLLLAGHVGLNGPELVVGGPVGGGHLVLEADVLVNAVDGGAVFDIVDDGLAVGDGVGGGPGAPWEAEGAADVVAGLEQGVGTIGGLFLEAKGGIDARDTGADDEDIEVELLDLQQNKMKRTRAAAPTGARGWASASLPSWMMGESNGASASPAPIAPPTTTRPVDEAVRRRRQQD
nr:hypothetical protein CFP56_01383 [Quercus suber]